jgi:geranylgeranyl diphosphate synthase type I
MTATLPMCLTETQDVVTPALRSAVERLDPLTRRQASYHLGWTTADGQPDNGGGGKALRPALALLSARAAGAAVDVGIPGAVAVELVHNFSLVHDDLIDGDLTRRHRPTVWSLWGVSGAILTGNALLALAYEVLLEQPGPNGAAAARLLAGCTQHLIRGQVEDVEFERRADVTLDECLTMAGGKTGSLIAASCAVGAVLAGADVERTAALQRYGHELGIAFQLIDDLLGIWGDPAVTGKPVGSDLRSRKNSLPVCYVLSRGDATAERLREVLAGAAGDEEARIATAAALVDEGGGRRWAAAEAQRRIADGEARLAGAGVPQPVLVELREVGQFVLGRQH